NSSANYISGIQAPAGYGGKMLSEMDNGPNSGWMYTVNGGHPKRGLEEQTLSNSDMIIWHYVHDFQLETSFEGSVPRYPSGWLQVADSNPPTDTPPGGDPPAGPGAPGGNPSSDDKKADDNAMPAAPTVTVDVSAEVKDSVAVAEVEPDIIKELIAEVKAEASGTAAANVVISVTNTEGATKVELNLVVASVKEIAENNMSLTVKSETATITFDTETLKTIAGDNSGDHTVVISAALVETETTLNARQQAAVGDNPVIELTITVDGKNIGELGGTVTVSIPYIPPAEMAAEDHDLMTVYYLDEQGNIKEMKGAKYDAGTGMITFATTHFSKFFVAEWINPFDDIDKTDWFYRSARFVSSNGLMNGTAADTFAPQTELTRAMLVTILWRHEGEPNAPFPEEIGTERRGLYSDVAAGEWYSEAIAWAAANGVVLGYEDGMFKPDELITREQFATIMYRYSSAQSAQGSGARGQGSEDGGYDYAAEYSDASDVSDWAHEAMKWANAYGLLTGRTATALAPKGSATRAEAAVILQRFLEN
ncbi:MAG: S-layer homology domain-containing protein, partial [Clostridiales bacterium]|nr:S-layer homology domain-containing protein [Clostridiales bacterium]